MEKVLGLDNPKLIKHKIELIRASKIIIKVLKKYFGVVFLLSIFLGSFHHHDDLEIHNDCPICILQTNITNADTPQENNHITSIELVNEAILENFITIYSYKFINSFHSRAPPYNS